MKLIQKKMNNKVFVSIDESLTSPKWLDYVELFVQKVLERLSLNNWEVSIYFCDDKYIAGLNKQYRNIDGSTDILSFELGAEDIDENGEKIFSAGDIIISIDSLSTNAIEFGVPKVEELQRLLIHGILHLNGYDHGDEHIERGVEPQNEMLKLQENILIELIKDNYIKEV